MSTMPLLEPELGNIRLTPFETLKLCEAYSLEVIIISREYAGYEVTVSQ